MSQPWTVLKILTWTTDFFKSKGIDSARLCAELLLADVLQVERIQLYVQYERMLSEAERGAYRALVKRRASGEPTQYILGRQGFWTLDLAVGPGVLVPRPDTEVLVEEAVAWAKRAAGLLSIADIGTGSGAIAAAVASEIPDARVIAGDASTEACRIAADNIGQLGLAERVEVVHADGLLPLVAKLDGRPFDAVLTNPPYIRPGDYAGLMREVRDWEPRSALVGPDDDGLGLVRRLIDEATPPTSLRSGGFIAIEIGDGAQARATRNYLQQREFVSIQVRDDYGGRPRVVSAMKR